MKINPYACYIRYLAIKRHFESDSYDAIKYRFKTNASEKSFDKRRDKYFFNKVLKLCDDEDTKVIDFFVAMLTKDIVWIGDMIKSEDIYIEHSKIMQSLSYTFANEIQTLEDECQTFDDLFRVVDNNLPLIIRMYMKGQINLQTVVILNKITSFVNRVDKDISDPIVWPDLKRKIIKYSPFLNIDLDAMKKTVILCYTQ